MIVRLSVLESSKSCCVLPPIKLSGRWSGTSFKPCWGLKIYSFNVFSSPLGSMEFSIGSLTLTQVQHFGLRNSLHHYYNCRELKLMHATVQQTKPLCFSFSHLSQLHALNNDKSHLFCIHLLVNVQAHLLTETSPPNTKHAISHVVVKVL